MLFLLELNFKQRLMVADIGFEIGEYHLGDILEYLPVLARGYSVT